MIWFLSLLIMLPGPLESASAGDTPKEPRAGVLGIPFEGTPGRHNAITDVPGVVVGHTTLIEGDGARAVRTGVTAIVPRPDPDYYPAASFVLNGDAELSGAIFSEEFGMLRSPIMFTGMGSNGTLYTAVMKWSARCSSGYPAPPLPAYVTGEQVRA